MVDIVVGVKGILENEVDLIVFSGSLFSRKDSYYIFVSFVRRNVGC